MEEQLSPYESPATLSPRPFSEIPGLWVKLFQMTEEFFAQEAPRASGSNVLVGLLVLAAVSAVFSAISSLIGGGMMAAFTPAEYRDAAVTSTGVSVVSSFCTGLVGTIIGFYLGSGILYILARIFGGSGNFGTQTYLQSLYAVPLGIVTSVVSLVTVIPVAGACLAGLVVLAASIYGIILSVRAIKVAHNMTTGSAVAAVLAPTLILLIIPCLVIVVLALLGPAVGNIFSDIITNI